MNLLIVSPAFPEPAAKLARHEIDVFALFFRHQTKITAFMSSKNMTFPYGIAAEDKSIVIVRKHKPYTHTSITIRNTKVYRYLSPILRSHVFDNDNLPADPIMTDEFLTNAASI